MSNIPKLPEIGNIPTSAISPVSSLVEQAQLELLHKQSALYELQAEELIRQKEKRLEEQRVQGAARAQNVTDIAKRLKEDQDRQANCSHRKPAPSHESAIAGQRDHSGVAHFICQYCQKQWLGSELPPQLRVPADRVGGPQL